MSNPTETLIEESIVTEPVVAVLEEKRCEWQPTDEDGRPIGAKQVIKYTSPEELQAKFQEQNNLLIRKLRSETKKNRLGIVTTDEIDETAQRQVIPVQFTPGQLTGEQRAKLAQDILDPDTFDTAITTVFETVSGFKAGDLRDTISELRQDNSDLKASREVDKFLYKNPDYVVVPENFEAITNWMLRYQLAPVAANFQKAYDTLRASDLLVTSLEVFPQPTYTPPAVVVTPTVVTEEVVPDGIREELPAENVLPIEVIPTRAEPVAEPKPVAARVPTGLNNRTSTASGTSAPALADTVVYEYIQRDSQGRQVGEKRVFSGLKAIDMMPSDEYKRRLLYEKGFAGKVKQLQDAADKRAFEKRQGR